MASTSLITDLKAFAPELVLVGFLIVLFLVDSIWKKSRENWAPLIITGIACLVGAIATYTVSQAPPALVFSKLVANDGFSAFFRYVFFFSCAAAAYLSFGTKELENKDRMEFVLLLLCVTFGLCLMATSTNLLMLYMGIETVSIVSFVMAGFRKEDLKANEASFKYFVFGALSSGLMLYGFSLLYGFAGSLEYGAIATALTSGAVPMPSYLIFAFVLIYAGLAYKVSAFPMHFWTPDIYEGAPTPVTTFFSVGPKAAGFAALIRFFFDLFAQNPQAGSWEIMGGSTTLGLIAIVSAITMTLGNLSAIGQTSTKRMLAYSSIAHVGYMLMGFVTADTFGLGAILFYIVAYCAMNFGAFWVVSIVADIKGHDRLDAFRGMGWSVPLLGVTMVIFLSSLAGIPMFAGFVGKMLLFGALMKTPGFLWLAILGVLNSVVSLYYYARILRELYLEGPEAAPQSQISWYHGIALVALAIPTVVFGLWFGPLVQFVERSVSAIL